MARGQRGRRPGRLGGERLESRAMLSVTSITVLADKTLKVVCDGGNDNVQVTEYIWNPHDFGGDPISTVTVKDLTKASANTWTYFRSRVAKITINGGDGDDTIDCQSSRPTTVYGGVGDDTISTGAGADFVSGGIGNDIIHTNGGDDRIDGGDGNDAISAGAGKDFVLGGAGGDLIDGGVGDDTLDGGIGADTIVGGDGADLIEGGDSDSTGNILNGDNGNDTINSRNRLDSIDGGAGVDLARVVAGVTVRNVETVLTAVPTDQPQNDGWSCGPNSGSRFLRAYGINASYASLRSETANDSLVAKLRLGTRPSVLRDIVHGHDPAVEIETESSLQHVKDLLLEGKPVIALVSVGTTNVYLGRIGQLHYVVLNGFDTTANTFRYVDTNGATKTWTAAQFERNWNWHNDFHGVGGNLVQGTLALAGMRERSILSRTTA